MFKVLLVVLFFAAVISLFSGLFFILKDQGQSGRTVKALSLRVLFCILLLLVIAYGILSGNLTPHNPWTG
ncbi:twin transmembrane helix small protein [Pontibacterium granulatum]|uniref:twin transmembrane helix small protein n=1 Tax=Pontibacterium granulatum TaxID=2036029 RepID=UPI00249A8AFD|nr:twin transmembrane helix small protein [Pontibacterium granulatum]MDI3325295.1 twin transmembrane helix small protein [Pontibacterium granulatum]